MRESKEQKVHDIDGSVYISVPWFAIGAAVVVGTLQSSMVATGLGLGLRLLGLVCWGLGASQRLEFAVTNRAQFGSALFIGGDDDGSSVSLECTRNAGIRSRSITTCTRIKLGCSIGNNVCGIGIRPFQSRGIRRTPRMDFTTYCMAAWRLPKARKDHDLQREVVEKGTRMSAR